MKPITATLLASVLAVAVSGAFAAEDRLDNAAYHSMTQQASTDYKLAAAKCTSMSGNERAVCTEEAKVARARINADAVAQHNNTRQMRIAARTALANAEHALATAKCSVQSGAEKDGCLANAHSVQVAAVADAKADREARVAAIDQCAQMSNGQPNTGCLIDKDRAAAPTVAQKTDNAAETALQKTKDAAATVADKTEHAAERVADSSGRAAGATGKVVADSVITTKVKADLFKEPELSSMAIHVETEKGIVMLSGFVDTKADADKAVSLAKGVEGVSQVKSAIKVK